MSIRDELKIQTRDKIIKKTSEILYKNGFVKVSTKDISKASSVSQGSIFLHFETKDNLLFTILSSNIVDIDNALTERCKPSDTEEVFVRELLNVFIEFENPLSRMYKDLAYLPESLQHEVSNLETQIKNLFYDNLKSNRSTIPSIIDSFVLIDAFMSQIKSYLLEKTVFTITNSILKQRRGRIMKLHRLMFV